MLINGIKHPLRGKVTVPGDKSISHRVVMLGAIAEGVTEATGFLPSDDVLSTIRCFQQLGVHIEQHGTDVHIDGVGLHGLKAPIHELNVGNSGTTLRLLTGLLSGQSFVVTLTGDTSIQRRPMRRVVAPLIQMGANINLKADGCAPFNILPAGPLNGINYKMPIASAQVKSALLLAGLYAKKPMTIEETIASRNHTEKMLTAFGANVSVAHGMIRLVPGNRLTGMSICVPGDISSAAFLLAATAMTPDSDVTVKNVGVNPTRTGMIDVLRAMGAQILLENIRVDNSGETQADIHIAYRPLKGTVISGELIPRLIDELPILAFVAATASGDTVIADAAELRVKESDRLKMMADGLAAFGVTYQERPDGLVISGGCKKLTAPSIAMDPAGDHRMAMSFSIAALAATGTLRLLNHECVSISYPRFFKTLETLGADVKEVTG